MAKRKIRLRAGESVFGVDFADGESLEAEGENALDAAKNASRRHARKKGKHVRVLRTRKA